MLKAWRGRKSGGINPVRTAPRFWTYYLERVWVIFCGIKRASGPCQTHGDDLMMASNRQKCCTFIFMLREDLGKVCHPFAEGAGGSFT